VRGIQANLEQNERHAEASLAVATALNPYIGYDAATAIVKDASGSGRSLREVAREHGVSEEILDKALDLHAMAHGSNTGEA
jgi:fumarate hydratase, class II